VLFFIGVDDVAAALAKAEQLGGRIVQPATEVPGVTFGVFADPRGHQVGLATAADPVEAGTRSPALAEPSAGRA
jgi:predicted enzyme related to lactoylglutathione lyase